MSNVSSSTGSINPYGAAVGGTSVGSSTGSATLSPEGLLAYCQSRLQSIDSQIQSGLDSQEQTNSELEQLGQVLSSMKALANGSSDSTQIIAAENALGDYINSLKTSDPNNPELGALTQTYNDMVYSGSGGDPNKLQGGPGFIDEAKYPPKHTDPRGDMNYGEAEGQGFIASVQSAHDDMNSNSELAMISLQSLMSQRQTAIELTTNMMQSLDDQADKIAQNIGH